MSGITFDSSGTSQQIAWATSALDELCIYPFRQFIDTANATVLVKWVDTLPGHTDSTHPYMVTEVTGVKTFLISIPKWADDSTAPEVQGLADPAGQVESFYKECFIHELGHVVVMCTFDVDDVDAQDNPAVAEVCKLFWRAAVNGEPHPGQSETTVFGRVAGTFAGSQITVGSRQYGTPADWEGDTGGRALAWPDEIREAVAEVFKVIYTNEPLIYNNRTNWRINGPNTIKLGMLFRGDPTVFTTGVIDSSPDYKQMLMTVKVTELATTGTSQASVRLTAAIPSPDQLATWQLDAGYYGGGESFFTNSLGDILFWSEGTNLMTVFESGFPMEPEELVASTGSNLIVLRVLGPDGLGNEVFSSVVMGDAGVLTVPFWLALRVDQDAGLWSVETWLEDPWDSASDGPLSSIEIPAPTLAAPGVSPELGFPLVGYRLEDSLTVPQAFIAGFARPFPEPFPIYLSPMDGPDFPAPVESVQIAEEGPSLSLGQVKLEFSPPSVTETSAFEDAFDRVASGVDLNPYYFSPWNFTQFITGSAQVGIPSGEFFPIQGEIAFNSSSDGLLRWYLPASESDIARPGFFIPEATFNDSLIDSAAPLRGAHPSRVPPTGRAPVKLVNPLTMTEQAAVAQALLDAGKKITTMQRRALIWQRAQDYRVKTRLGVAPTQQEIDAFGQLGQSPTATGAQQKMNPGTLRGALRQ